MTADWSQIGERGSMRGLRAVLAIYRFGGRPITLVLVHLIVFYYFLTIPGGRRASRAYLRRIVARPEGARALGRRPDTIASFLHFRAFALSIFDRIELWLGRGDAFRFEVTGREHYARLLTPTRGGILVGAHLGSFDALRILSRHDGRVVNVVMFTSNAPRINAFFRLLSPDAEVRVLPGDADPASTALRIRSCVERGELVAILGDRMEAGDRGRSCRVPFLGDPAEIPTAPYWLAAVLGCPLFFMVALRADASTYRVFAEVLSEGAKPGRGEREKHVEELAAAYARRLEHYCLEEPLQWFNYYDYWREDT